MSRGAKLNERAEEMYDAAKSRRPDSVDRAGNLAWCREVLA